MADKRCENGHYIDESWDLCPYCPAASDTAMVHPAKPAESRRPPEAPVRPQLAAVPRPRPLTSDSGEVDRTVVVRSAESEREIDTGRRYVVGWLVGLSGSARGESFPVRMGKNVLGRDRRADVVVNDDQASSHHADLIFRPDEARYILMDHNSTNGTFVNEAEIVPRRDLGPRDVIRIGSHRFLFVPLCARGRIWDSEGELA